MIKFICLIILLLITFIYNGYVLMKYKKIPESLSETSYLFGGNKRYFFTLYTLCISGFLLPLLLTYTSEMLEFLPFIFCGGILFAGFSPLFKEKIDKEVHYTAALISFISFIFYLVFYMGWQWFLAYLITFLITFFIWKKEKIVYFAEMIGILMLIIWLLTIKV